MQAIQHFSENERAYLVYQQRLEAEYVEQTWKTQIAQLQQRVERERQKREQLLALLKQAGIEPLPEQEG